MPWTTDSHLPRPAGAHCLHDGPTNPWVHTVGCFYDHLERGRRTLARQLTADDATFRALAAAPEASAEAEDGDLALGDGWVRMWTEARPLLVSVRRAADGRWRIVSVSDKVQPEL